MHRLRICPSYRSACVWLICAATMFSGELQTVFRAQAGVVRVVGAQEAAQHLLKRIDPRYPTLAEAAHVRGSVSLLVEVNEAGKVGKVVVAVSVPMLDQSAVDAVKSATFASFTEDGAPVPALVSAVVSFGLGGRPTVVFDDTLSQAMPAVTDCQRAAATSADKASVAICQRAVDATTAAGPAASAWRMRSLWLLGRGQVAAGLLAEGVRSFDEAARPVRLAAGSEVYPTGEILADAARAHVAAGDPKGSVNLFIRAETQFRSQLAQLTPQAADRDARVSQLRSLLTDYAAALTAAGLTKDAEQVRQRAADVP